MRYFVCQPREYPHVPVPENQESPKPFLAWLSDSQYETLQLALGGAKRERACYIAIRYAFDVYCAYAEISSAEWFAAMRAAGDAGRDDGGARVPVHPKPKPTKPLNGIARRMAIHSPQDCAAVAT
jgi:hypothetical protein